MIHERVLQEVPPEMRDWLLNRASAHSWDATARDVATWTCAALLRQDGEGAVNLHEHRALLDHQSPAVRAIAESLGMSRRRWGRGRIVKATIEYFGIYGAYDDLTERLRSGKLPEQSAA